MQRKTTKKTLARASVPLPEGAQAIVDQLVQGPMTAEAIEMLSGQLKKALIERALRAELGYHLAHEEPSEEAANDRNGGSGKTVLTGDGPVLIDIPRDRSGTFRPIRIPTHERRFTDFDDMIIAMYARGMRAREIHALFARAVRNGGVAPEFISSVTDEVMEEVAAWQSRPLETTYPVVFFDALGVKIREEAVVRNQAVDLALGAVSPATTLQTCIVHSIRSSLDDAGWKDRKELAKAPCGRSTPRRARKPPWRPCSSSRRAPTASATRAWRSGSDGPGRR